MTRRGLGKGLGALIPGAAGDVESSAYEVGVSELSPNPFQPREHVGGPEFEELVASIQRHGVLQPIVVRRVSSGYEIAAGERRWRAAQQAGLGRVPVVVKDLSDQDMLVVALIENLRREDLNPVERAHAYKRLLEEFGMTQEQVAEMTGSSRSSIANAVRLLDLPTEIQRAISAGRITEGHGRALLMAEDNRLRLELWKIVEERGLSVRETERLVRSRLRSVSRETFPRQAGRDPHLVSVSRDLEERYLVPVEIVRKGKKGSIRFHFYSNEDLERIIELLLRS